MGQKLLHRIEDWKKRLLDFGKRNKLINFKATKRSNVKIIIPQFEGLFDTIVVHEKRLTFPFAKKVRFNDNGDEVYDAIVSGDIETDKPLGDLQKTLKVLRYRANTSIEEQGINILFLSFGLLKWIEDDNSNQVLYSPIILVPVKLTIESLTSPYVLSLHEDEVVVNPTLAYKLEHDFGIIVPEFDSSKDDISNYIRGLSKIIKNKDWEIIKEVHLTLLSFLKINMYKDLERNEEKLNINPIITAITGESDNLSFPNELNNYDHDHNTRPIDTFQVLDADSSQQDAVLLSKHGVSFVLQGPPGTGKSQTIANIISEALSDGKKVLFVSEKMAALQVVHKRLSQVGLADYCMTLHSHKANKKEFLKELANSISIDRTRVREEALNQLDTLDKKRKLLNDYQRELHTPCSDLNYTIYDVNGKLAKLDHVPEVIFEIADAEKTTQSELNERRQLLSDLSKTIGKRSEDYLHNVWRNATIIFLSHQLRHDIDSNISSLLPKIEEINELFEQCCRKLGLSINPSFEGLDLLIQLLSLASKSPIIPAKWIFNRDIEKLQNKAYWYKEYTNTIIELQSTISKHYNEHFYSINGREQKELLTDLLDTISRKIKSCNQCSDLKCFEYTLTQISTVLNSLSELYNKSKEIAISLGVDEPKNLSRIKFIIKLANTLSTIIMPTDLWFDESRFNKIEGYIEDSQKLHEEVQKLRQEILSKFDKEIFDIDSYSILKRMRGKYGSIFRIFQSDYRKEIKTLKQYLSNSSKLNFKNACDVLNKLKVISEKIELINNEKDDFLMCFGRYYKGLDTSWRQIKEDVNKFNKIASMFTSSYMPDKLKKMILAQTLTHSELSEYAFKFSTSSCDEILEKINNLIVEICDEQTHVDYIIDILEHIVLKGKHFIELYKEILEKRKEAAQFDVIISELSQLAHMQGLYKNMTDHEQETSEQYEQYYTGTTTDWDKIMEALIFAKEFETFIENNNLPKEFIDKVCTDESSVSFCKTAVINMLNEKDMINESMKWIIGLFNESEKLDQYFFKDLIDRFTKCKNNKHLLEEWIDYYSIRCLCEEKGLRPYIKQVEEKSIKPDYIVDAYLKRFYRLWLDVILPQFHAVQSFRGRNHDQLIKEFCELDKAQLKIAQLRVKERILRRIPDFNSITSTRDEIGILKREIIKQRKLMPLRKLFNSIPNLLTVLRPCFMMSPLSVSVFLEAKSYYFDLVVFDEASQVHTEDAIGAIMRGKQVIIVGDTKQLPPTSFFTNSVQDDDFDIDIEETENEIGAFQSILDEAVTVLPERSLRWHYRSRHEYLIAFSNVKIYNNTLITFPSSTEKAPDCGVEYIYEPNGIYDRGGKRNNIIEAKKIADLVFAHYEMYPNRSLGVVTFSEAQQQAVEAAILQRRHQNTSKEQFFLEDKEEPFFIKNLENVQGDERDTIIFSIGYARDSKGTMYMSFGPLSKDGGYRRLNVAITRAKHNIKLVGSIMPTDIDLERTSSEGVKLLRSYIEFAQQGIVALQKELSYTSAIEFDSPFEEAVYDFLITKGYEVVTQVGCSGYRIDMAIKHPYYSGKFALGIECDGATYHNSRTARERDRLRQAVLEDMGWKIYRIWSTDWIKSSTSEGEKLVAVIEKSIANYREITPKKPSKGNEPNFDDFESIDKNELSETEKKNPYGFVPLTRTDFSALPRNSSGYLNITDCIMASVNNEFPLHYELLCKNLAYLYKRKKATIAVRREVDYGLRKLGSKVLKKGDFLFPTEYSTIVVRTPNTRTINHVSVEELSEAMFVIQKKSIGITREGLCTETSRVYSWARMTQGISASMNAACDLLISQGRVKEIDGKIV